MADTVKTKSSPRRFLHPPLTMEWTVEQEQRYHSVLHIRLKSGNHCFRHDHIVCFYDSTASIPPIVVNALMRYSAWFVEFERGRRLATPGQPLPAQIRSPQLGNVEFIIQPSDTVERD